MQNHRNRVQNAHLHISSHTALLLCCHNKWKLLYPKRARVIKNSITGLPEAVQTCVQGHTKAPFSSFHVQDGVNTNCLRDMKATLKCLCSMVSEGWFWELRSWRVSSLLFVRFVLKLHMYRYLNKGKY